MKTQGSQKQAGEVDAIEAAKIIGVSPTTVRRFIQDGLIPFAHRNGVKVIKTTAAKKVHLARIARGSEWAKIVIYENEDSFGPTQLPLIEAPQDVDLKPVNQDSVKRRKMLDIARTLIDLDEPRLSILVSDRVCELIPL